MRPVHPRAMRDWGCHVSGERTREMKFDDFIQSKAITAELKAEGKEEAIEELVG